MRYNFFMKKSIYISIKKGVATYEASAFVKPYEDNNYTVVTLGNFYINNSPASSEDLLNIYLKHHRNTYKHLDGVGSLFVVDRTQNKLFCFTDFFNSNLPVYLCKNNSELIISSELKLIKRNAYFDFSFDKIGVNNFIKKGYITGKRTLIKGISKLPPKHYLEVSLLNNSYSFKRTQNPLKYLGTKDVTFESYDNAVDTISKSIIRDNYSLPLTCGFDTNYLFYHIRKNEKENKIINALCIGGEIGWNEIGDSKAVISHYKNVSLNTSIVNGDTLESFPEIVSILEGAIYEHGIFLQYALGNLTSNNNFDRIILGECADQILNYDVCHPANGILKKLNHFLKSKYYKLIKGVDIVPYKDFYEMGSYKIIKKSGLILNHYGIETEHPYIRNIFLKEGINAAIKGDLKKTYHKKVVSNFLQHDIVQMLVKKPGATELRTLFIGDISYDDVVNYAKKSAFYKEKLFNDNIYEMHYYMKLTYLNLFDELFVSNDFDYLDSNENYKKLSYFINSKSSVKI